MYHIYRKKYRKKVLFSPVIQSTFLNRDLPDQLVQVSEPHLSMLIIKIFPHRENNVISFISSRLNLHVVQEQLHLLIAHNFLLTMTRCWVGGGRVWSRDVGSFSILSVLPLLTRSALRALVLLFRTSTSDGYF